ncbi:uncharacterized protein LOC124848743 [Vigna umbellata]|uniref:uncharacterized protein LOC124848743 n=1 Tax=Vigna umbellata TaxID=87088 RepID=UPI001F5F0F92|nr:uncharacterized protein LOC124848743 [Vigna umbellata]
MNFASQILKPAFTIIRDKESKCLLVFIRGTRSIKDTLTDALCAPVSFNHNTVSGHAHRGMDAAASWIGERCIPVLLKALHQYPHFKIKIVGHSLGGGTAALLTYKLREIQQLSSTTCVTFGPAACMTLELAEFGKPFVTSIVNGSDIVPTMSASSVHDFIAEDRTKDNKNISGIRARLSFAKAVTKYAANYCYEAVKKHVKKHKHSWLPKSKSEKTHTLSDNLGEASGSSGTRFLPLSSEERLQIESINDDAEYISSNEGSDNMDDSDDDEEQLLNQTGNHEEDSVSQDTTLARRRLYPPGRIMHMITSQMSENSNSNHNDADEKYVCLYQTPTQLYGKLRFSRGMILDHRTKKHVSSLYASVLHATEAVSRFLTISDEKPGKLVHV